MTECKARYRLPTETPDSPKSRDDEFPDTTGPRAPEAAPTQSASGAEVRMMRAPTLRRKSRPKGRWFAVSGLQGAVSAEI